MSKSMEHAMQNTTYAKLMHRLFKDMFDGYSPENGESNGKQIQHGMDMGGFIGQ